MAVSQIRFVDGSYRVANSELRMGMPIATQPSEGSYYDSVKLLGYPQQIQQCILMETVYKNLKSGWYNPDERQRDGGLEITEKTKADVLRWRHLFSFPVESFTKMSQSKGVFNKHMDGIFNVMIKDTDLDKMNFDHTESVYQST